MFTTLRKTDSEIRDQVIQELKWDCRTETSPITVSVSEGAVTLSGQVKYYAVKYAAEEAAYRVAGVVTVRDQVEVKIPYAEYRGNCEVAEAVRQAFEWNVFIPHEQLTVIVNNGIVTLTGKVNCLFQREEAERTVINLLGVRGIENHIAVKAQPLAAEKVLTELKNTWERHAVEKTTEVTVEVQENAIRLSGMVVSWSHRCSVVNAAGFAHGVSKVVDNLTIETVRGSR